MLSAEVSGTASLKYTILDIPHAEQEGGVRLMAWAVKS